MDGSACTKECWKVFHHTNGNHRNDCPAGNSKSRKDILWARRQARYKKMTMDELGALSDKLAGKGPNWLSEERYEVSKAWADKFECEIKKCIQVDNPHN